MEAAASCDVLLYGGGRGGGMPREARRGYVVALRLERVTRCCGDDSSWWRFGKLQRNGRIRSLLESVLNHRALLQHIRHAVQFEHALYKRLEVLFLLCSSHM